MDQMLASMDVDRSEAFKPSDKEKILATVRGAVDISSLRLNAIVLSLMRNWVLNMAAEKLTRCVQVHGYYRNETM
jgi:hypothetical protein